MPGGLVDSLRKRVRFDRNELAGAFGDIGTDLPLLVAMIPAAGLDSAAVFTMFGLMQILTGLLYGLPMPMQPLKAMAVIVITERLAGSVLFGAGLGIAVVMLVLAASGALGWLARVIPPCVVRGVQLGLALKLATLALGTYVPAHGLWGFGLAGLCFVVVIVLHGNRRLPPALPVIAIGIVAALWSGVDLGAVADGLGPRLPELHTPSWSDITAGFVALALPQIPLSLSNSVIATEQTVKDLFPDRAISARKIGITYGLANVILPFFGGVPVCHGCGGLVGHHAFGARTGGSVVIYGTLYLTLGLVLSGAADEVVRLFPHPVLGVILFFEALALGSLVRSVASSKRDLIIALVVGMLACNLPQGFVVGTVVGLILFYTARRFGRDG